ncbi:MAG: glycosyltransferase, partial [Burkholderiales bacterium]
YEQLRERLIAPHEGGIRMNQVSPKIFEAIACGTALVLFEGEYSDVVKPGQHFIVLKKDFSNVDEVLDALRDDAFISQLTERAYRDVVASGAYSYRRFVEAFDESLTGELRFGPKMRVLRKTLMRLPAGKGTGNREAFAPAVDAPLGAADWSLVRTTEWRAVDTVNAAAMRVSGSVVRVARLHRSAVEELKERLKAVLAATRGRLPKPVRTALRPVLKWVMRKVGS